MYFISEWDREHEELQSQVSHPLADYDESTPEGKARMDRLREQIAMSQRFTWPSVLTMNV